MYYLTFSKARIRYQLHSKSRHWIGILALVTALVIFENRYLKNTIKLNFKLWYAFLSYLLMKRILLFLQLQIHSPCLLHLLVPFCSYQLLLTYLVQYSLHHIDVELHRFTLSSQILLPTSQSQRGPLQSPPPSQ